MSYENAPATKLVATNCIACGKDLLDAISVETGMGPICREKYGHAGPDGATEAARADVNWRVHELAAGVSPAVMVGHLLIIRSHWFDKLADRLTERLCAVEIEPVDANTLALVTPYNEAFTYDLKTTVDGRRWDPANKRWTIPATREARNAAWKVIRKHFAGGIGRGPEGLFPIEVARAA